MLKVDLHMHTNYLQKKETEYSPKELIDRALEKGFDAICITEHYWPFINYPEYKKNPLKTYSDFKGYAQKRGLLLIPGAEIQFKEGDVLLINFKGDVREIKKLSDLKKIPDNVLIAAPHPYYKSVICLGKDLEKNKDLFHAVEHSFFYTTFFNPNKKAIKFAEKNQKPLIGNSDLHSFKWLGYTYTLVDAEKNAESIIKAVKENKIQLVTRPLPMKLFLYIVYFHLLNSPEKVWHKITREVNALISKSS
ncbi:MAG: PHP domain-containing protein [Nanoarchaeota archaeon]|nr:PHP domain-containing protein [Nanoarchaeota archaeon]